MAETIIAPSDLSDEQIDMILDAAKVPEPPGNEDYRDYDVRVARAILAHLADELRDAARYRSASKTRATASSSQPAATARGASAATAASAASRIWLTA
jgi:hypothetical protein